MWTVCNPKNEGEMRECSMLGKSLSRLVQPTILTVLAASDKPLHGYLIVKEAANAPTFGGKKPDATGVYRTLKLMEENGLVTSEWDMPKAGPAKRAFTLTDSGRATLRRWIDSLACYELTVEEVRKEAAAALEIPLPNAPVCHD